MIEDRKYSFKTNLIFGVVFLLASAMYLLKTLAEPISFINCFILGSTSLVSITWFILSFRNYKKSKEIEKRLKD